MNGEDMVDIGTDPSNSADDISEFLTRKKFIDTQLEDVGWVLNKDWFNEKEYPGMPNSAGVGYVDYVLNGTDGRPIAIIEAKRTSKDLAVGRHQAELYADIIEKAKGRRPIIFLSNGYEIRMIDDAHGYPERRVSGVYSKSDLERIYRLGSNRDPILTNASIDESITNRYYQKTAVKAVCEAFQFCHRKALLVMATGSGKTRTVLSIIKVLLEKGWINRILFLADRLTLLKQAKKSMDRFLPNMPCSNLTSDEKNHDARIILSTYETMMNCIDVTKSPDGKKIYTNGHFDLVITDEAHRSIYNKYGAIFDYFDSLLIGLTATPKSDIDKNTYRVFDLDDKMPTYAYELAQAVLDGYLVNYTSIETSTKFMEGGITYIDLTDEEKEEYENSFTDLDGNVPERIDSKLLNEWVFNRSTIAMVIQDLMNKGLKVNFGSTLGKSIIFAKNHRHAEEIYKVFNELYPNHAGECVVIDNYSNYAQDNIDKFTDGQKIRIVISVDMVDTGVDVPDVLNLVFFKKIYSTCKFWQMIGRGTRLCPNLIDGRDKQGFYIFDYCNNFKFFRINPRGREVGSQDSIQSKIFAKKLELIGILGNLQYSHYGGLRKELVDDVVFKIRELNKDLFSVKMHLRCIEIYSKPESFEVFTEDDVTYIINQIAGLIQPYNGNIDALTFDFLMYNQEISNLRKEPNKWILNQIRKRVDALTVAGSIPSVQEKKELILSVLEEGFLENSDIPNLEKIRRELRDLMKYIEKIKRSIFYTDFTDSVIDSQVNEGDLGDLEITDYKVKAEAYIRKHMDEGVIKKLYTNIPLDEEDIAKLQNILWSEVGSKDDYVRYYNTKHLGVMVRDIIGLDMNSAKQAFSEFLNDSEFTPDQINFVNHIVEYVVRNGTMQDFTVFQHAPFTEKGGLLEVFGKDLNRWAAVKSVVESINRNAEISE